MDNKNNIPKDRKDTFFNRVISSLYAKMAIPALLLFVVTFFTDGMYAAATEYNVFTFMLMVLLNVFPLYFMIFFLYHITVRLWAATSVTALTFGIFHTVNCYKIIYRADPFKLADLMTVKETSDIIQNYDLILQPANVTMWILFVIIAVLVAVFEYKGFFNDKEYPAPRTKIISYSAKTVVSLVIMILVYCLVYRTPFLINPVNETTEYMDSVKRQRRIGFITYVLSARVSDEFPEPDKYDNTDVMKLVDKYEKKAKEKFPDDNLVKPNVIAVMNEAFFDPQSGANVKFYPDKNPLKNFNRIKAYPYTYSGGILVPGIGGGTSDTEYEFLTGSNVSVIDTSIPPVYKTYLKKETFSIVHHFKSLGYETHAIHPGHRWFYNRGEVYDWLGFDDFLTVDSLPEDTERINYYVTDDVAFDLIKESYDDYLSGKDKGGYFNFTVTIQNHGPYMDYKTDRDPVLIRNGIEDEKLYNVMNNYMAGLEDADRMLGNLEEYIESIHEPTVVVFFGDHLPYFDEKREGFRLLGIDVEDELSDIAKRHTTPYIIFGNKSFRDMKQAMDISSNSENGEVISSGFLAGELFDYTLIPKPAMFMFIEDLRLRIDAIRNGSFYINDGIVTREAPHDAKELISDYSKLIYYYNTQWSN